MTLPHEQRVDQESYLPEEMMCFTLLQLEKQAKMAAGGNMKEEEEDSLLTDK